MYLRVAGAAGDGWCCLLTSDQVLGLRLGDRVAEPGLLGLRLGDRVGEPGREPLLEPGREPLLELAREPCELRGRSAASDVRSAAGFGS